MLLVVLLLSILGICIAAHIWGAWSLAKYGFRLSTGTGLAVLLIPPYAFYFAFFKLEQEGKETPTALWAFGLIVAALMVLAFQEPLGYVARGQISELAAMTTSAAEEAVRQYGASEEDLQKAREQEEEMRRQREARSVAPSPAPEAPAPDAPATDTPPEGEEQAAEGEEAPETL